jgi:hypothetical protein
VVPSRRAAAIHVLGLLLTCAGVCLGVAWPWWLLVATCAFLATANLVCLSRFILLRGIRGVRAVEWSEGDQSCGFTVVLGESETAVAATLVTGSFRLGCRLLVLHFRTPAGLCPVLIDGAVQDVSAFRSLCRTLESRLRLASRGSVNAN